jgi:LEA14-like dessication related protein
MSGRHLAWVMTLLCLGGCTTLASHDPLQVTVAGIEPLQGEGLELRMLTKLRVQNPNDSPIDYRGVYVKIELQGKTFATGVTDVSGIIPAFGESVIEVPVTASAMRMAHQFFGLVHAREPPDKLQYSMSGKLSGGGTFGSQRFEASGEFSLKPPEPAETATSI